MPILVVLLAGWASAQAFSFCFSFGGSSRPDFHDRPPPEVGFGSGIYRTSPFGSAAWQPSVISYDMPPLPPASAVRESSAITDMPPPPPGFYRSSTLLPRVSK
jgi:hypothetical protein